MAPRTRSELQLVAHALSPFPERRLEIGSRLGPGRPMATDPVLRTERARIIRNELIALGVRPERLVLEQDGTYERVVEDIGREVGRFQSIGVCVHG